MTLPLGISAGATGTALCGLPGLPARCPGHALSARQAGAKDGLGGPGRYPGSGGPKAVPVRGPCRLAGLCRQDRCPSGAALGPPSARKRGLLRDPVQAHTQGVKRPEGAQGVASAPLDRDGVHQHSLNVVKQFRVGAFVCSEHGSCIRWMQVAPAPQVDRRITTTSTQGYSHAPRNGLHVASDNLGCPLPGSRIFPLASLGVLSLHTVVAFITCNALTSVGSPAPALTGIGHPRHAPGRL